MMVIHFPSAFLPGDLAFSALELLYPGHNLEWAGYYCLFAGVVMGGVAMLAGFMDVFLYIVRHGEAAIRKAWIHSAIQSTVIIGFTMLLAAEFNHPEYVTDTPVWLWVSKSLLCAMMIAGNYLGGELVFRYVAKKFGARDRPA
jgi:uncharacterized membrane protein